MLLASAFSLLAFAGIIPLSKDLGALIGRDSVLSPFVSLQQLLGLGYSQALWAGRGEEDFLPTLVLTQLFLFLQKHQFSPAPSWFLLLRCQHMPKSLLDQVHPVTVQRTALPFPPPQAFPNISFYPLCQELILSSCFPSPINNPFPPTRLAEQRRARVMCLP